MRGTKSITISVLAVSLLAGSVVGVAAQDDSMAPAAVTGTVSSGEQLSGGSKLWEDGAIRGDGAAWSHEFEASDPRLSGTRIATYAYDLYERQEMMVVDGTVVIENEDGRWVGPASQLGGAILGETSTMVLSGEDAYEGLTAYVVVDEAGRTFSAAIFPGAMPDHIQAPVE